MERNNQDIRGLPEERGMMNSTKKKPKAQRNSGQQQNKSDRQKNKRR